MNDSPDPQRTACADQREIEISVHVAVTTAPNYVLREVFERSRFDRSHAVAVIVQRVLHALRRYDLMREPKAEETAPVKLPLFPD